MGERPVGKTKGVGWQIGVSRTMPVDLDEAWEYLVSPAGLEVWLGAGVDTPLTKGQRYTTVAGTTGEVRSVREHDRVRLTWQPADRADDATVQIAVVAAATGCTLRFHTERLYDSAEREAMRAHWRAIVDAIEARLVGG